MLELLIEKVNLKMIRGRLLSVIIRIRIRRFLKINHRNVSHLFLIPNEFWCKHFFVELK